MPLHFLAAKLGARPDLATIIILFFMYSFIGYVMECVVLTAEKKRLVLNRGFVQHLPFCIIYGFGALIGFAVLSPLAKNPILLFMAGAVCASLFEYFVARLQLRMFGDFWWDYTEKKFNYQGILCLESTIGWGIVALLVILVLHRNLVFAVSLIPTRITTLLAMLLVGAYAIDFLYSAAQARMKRNMEITQEKTEEAALYDLQEE